MGNHKFRYILMIILVIICFAHLAAAEKSYSITEVSKYDFEASILMIHIHGDLTPLSEPDLRAAKENLRNAGWNMKFHKRNHAVKESVFQNELQNSDLHIHVGHGYNIPFIGGHIELSDYVVPSISQGRGGWVSAHEVKEAWKHKSPKLWTVIHSCHVLETDHQWAEVLRNSKMHGILGFGSTEYSTGHLLADFTEAAVKYQKPITEAWESAGLKNQLSVQLDPVKVRTIFRNIDQYKTDTLGTPSTNMNEETVVCDMQLDKDKVGKSQIKGSCKALNSGQKTHFSYDIRYSSSSSSPKTVVSAKKSYTTATPQAKMTSNTHIDL
nr:DUF6345 domain-containing protein [uncultured Methanocorpusculum sp.]